MESLLSNIRINISECLYVKDPESSKLGRRILSNSISLIDRLGFEEFNFKKLGQEIQSNESSIYRYFENKQKLLQYLSALYWGILEYRLVVETTAIQNPEERLYKAVEIVTKNPQSISTQPHINLHNLRNIIIAEFTKSYHQKHVDEDNSEGSFSIYKRLVLRIAEMIQLVDSNFKFPKSLASTILDGALHQFFISAHFKSISDTASNSEVFDFFNQMISRLLNRTTNGSK
ncbi:TetR/AcrR family transcriptional regulator [Psychroflexus sp. ALD_RP9]|uniref:TetR/AcrR family transcriptional regulator n=1 Tax=Psychroflexus sp. ALD_RP9 TaxID=2777186 RepID=UPI001A8E0E69|nr:TetR/AcrR family transcriptional regulator [Psychroflexus sp. ALD_RP9]QSS96050.1 TetR/AcrR family transcriptional regulator [Psychroflexus sp. ALD_RP9]